jgi:hypothetical protein
MNAIEQLKSVLCDPEGKCCITGSDEDRATVDRALQALAAQQEPCGWQFYQDGKWHNGMEINNHRANTEAAGVPVRDVYPTPTAQPAPEQQEPVGVYGHCPVCGAKGVTRERRPGGDDRCANGHTYKSIHATTPPAAQRQWVGLTEDEIEKLRESFATRPAIGAIEAKLKEKNT